PESHVVGSSMGVFSFLMVSVVLVIVLTVRMQVTRFCPLYTRECLKRMTLTERESSIPLPRAFLTRVTALTAPDLPWTHAGQFDRPAGGIHARCGWENVLGVPTVGIDDLFRSIPCGDIGHLMINDVPLLISA